MATGGSEESGAGSNAPGNEWSEADEENLRNNLAVEGQVIKRFIIDYFASKPGEYFLELAEWLDSLDEENRERLKQRIPALSGLLQEWFERFQDNEG